jgi:hypothetical protein
MERWRKSQAAAYLRYAVAKAGTPPGHSKLLAIGKLLARVDSPSEEQTWLMTGICKIVQDGEDPARALELKWPRRGRPTNASLHRESIELEKAVSIARHIDSDPKPRGRTGRAIAATAKDYRCGQDGLLKIWSKLRDDAWDQLEAERREEERERRQGEIEEEERIYREAVEEHRWRESRSTGGKK